MLVEIDSNKNVMALVVNDYYCATILENGEIKIVRKGNRRDKKDFGTILSLENEYIDKRNELLDLENKISKTRANSIVIIIQGVVSSYFLALSTFVFNGIPSIISLIGKIFLGIVSASSIGLVISNIKKNKQNKKEFLKLKRKVRRMSMELGDITLLKDSIFIPTRDNRESIEKCQRNIRQSAELIHALLKNYVDSHTREEIVKYEEIYFDSDLFEDEDINIKIPMRNVEVEKAKVIAQDCMARKSIMDFRSERLMLVDEKEKEASHVLKKKFPF